MSWVLGIDLGTSFTAAGILSGPRLEPLALGAHSSAIPSAVYRGDGSTVVGEAALAQGDVHPDRLAVEFKRQFGESAPLLSGQTFVSPEELENALGTWVFQRACELEGSPPSEVVFTFPAFWGAYRRDLFLGIARQVVADPDKVALVTEPEAAAIYYAKRDRLPPGAVVGVYDLGGGTFDASILRKTDEGFEVLGRPAGDDQLGGVDFDLVLLQYVIQQAGLAWEGLDRENPQTVREMMHLRRNVTVAKELLSHGADGRGAGVGRDGPDDGAPDPPRAGATGRPAHHPQRERLRDGPGLRRRDRPPAPLDPVGRRRQPHAEDRRDAEGALQHVDRAGQPPEVRRLPGRGDVGPDGGGAGRPAAAAGAGAGGSAAAADRGRPRGGGGRRRSPPTASTGKQRRRWVPILIAAVVVAAVAVVAFLVFGRSGSSGPDIPRAASPLPTSVLLFSHYDSNANQWSIDSAPADGSAATDRDRERAGGAQLARGALAGSTVPRLHGRAREREVPRGRRHPGQGAPDRGHRRRRAGAGDVVADG